MHLSETKLVYKKFIQIVNDFKKNTLKSMWSNKNIEICQTLKKNKQISLKSLLTEKNTI